MPSPSVEKLIAEFLLTPKAELDLDKHWLDETEWQDLIAGADVFLSVTTLRLGSLTVRFRTAIKFAERLDGLIHFQCSDLGDTDVCHIAQRFGNLTTLHLGWRSWVGDVGVMAVAKHLRNLTTLGLDGCKYVTDAGVEAVAKHLPNLTTLGLGGCKSVTDVGVEAVAKHLRKLTALHLDGAGGEIVDMTDVGVAAVAKHLRNLITLNLGNTRVTDVGVAEVAKHLPNLTTLGLGGTSVTDVGVAAVAKHLRNLATLDLRYCKTITKIGLRSLAESHHRGDLAQLRTLNVEGIPSNLPEEVVRAIR